MPGGVMRTTNLVSAFEDQKALGAWEQQRLMRGLAVDVSLYEELVVLVRRAMRDGVDWDELTARHPDMVAALTGAPGDSASHDASLAGRAKHLGGANIARERGTHRHTMWQYRPDEIGTPEMLEQADALEALLAANNLVRVPELRERVIFNEAVNCAGRFDDILLSTRSGTLYMADLKTKRRPFKSMLTVDGQLAVYANAEWMLSANQQYEPGPFGQVDMERGIVLVMPSDGSPPYLRPADLVRGWANAQLARRIVDERSYARSVARQQWREGEAW
jgi:hypothetical protein